jgi:hypothetical protein
MSSSYCAYFVRTENTNRAHSIFGTLEPVEGSAWVMCDHRRGAAPPDDDVLWGRTSLTADRSQQLGEVLYVYGDTSCDGFVYEHARDGVLMRKLVWFPLLDEDWTAGWLCAQGEPEAWEEAFFRAHALEEVIEEERGRFEDEGREEDFPDHEAEIRRAWARKRIVPATTYPRCDATVARLVERVHGIVRS